MTFIIKYQTYSYIPEFHSVMCIFELSLSLDENFSAIGLKCIFGLPPSWHGHLDYWRTVLLVAGTFPTSF